jgi:hypothetical protein
MLLVISFGGIQTDYGNSLRIAAARRLKKSAVLIREFGGIRIANRQAISLFQTKK